MATFINSEKRAGDLIHFLEPMIAYDKMGTTYQIESGDTGIIVSIEELRTYTVPTEQYTVFLGNIFLHFNLGEISGGHEKYM